MTRSPSKLERVLFAVTASLALPYLILSIRLHLSNLRAVDAYSSVQVPEQHHWITENLAKHYQKSLSSSIRGGAGGAHSSGRDDGRERPEIAPSSSAPAAVAAAPSRALSLSLEAPFIFHGLKSSALAAKWSTSGFDNGASIFLGWVQPSLERLHRGTAPLSLGSCLLRFFLQLAAIIIATVVGPGGSARGAYEKCQARAIVAHTL